MAHVYVEFRNRLDENGNTCEYPGDQLQTGGVDVLTFEFTESTIRDGEQFAREIWSFDVEDKDADKFIEAAANSPTVLSAKQYWPIRERKLDIVEAAMKASTVNGVGPWDIEAVIDNDWANQDEHSAWLETATVDEIAKWASGIADAEALEMHSNN